MVGLLLWCSLVSLGYRLELLVELDQGILKLSQPLRIWSFRFWEGSYGLLEPL